MLTNEQRNAKINAVPTNARKSIRRDVFIEDIRAVPQFNEMVKNETKHPDVNIGDIIYKYIVEYTLDGVLHEDQINHYSFDHLNKDEFIDRPAVIKFNVFELDRKDYFDKWLTEANGYYTTDNKTELLRRFGIVFLTPTGAPRKTSAKPNAEDLAVITEALENKLVAKNILGLRMKRQPVLTDEEKIILNWDAKYRAQAKYMPQPTVESDPMIATGAQGNATP